MPWAFFMSRNHRAIPRQDLARLALAAKERDDYRCQNPDCGRVGLVEAHHKIPLEKGGVHDLENLICYCPECHVAIHQPDRCSPERLAWLNLVKDMVTQ